MWSPFPLATKYVLHMGIYGEPITLHDILSIISYFLIFMFILSFFFLKILTHTPVLSFIQPTAKTEKNGMPQGKKNQSYEIRVCSTCSFLGEKKIQIRKKWKLNQPACSSTLFRAWEADQYPKAALPSAFPLSLPVGVRSGCLFPQHPPCEIAANW